MVLKPSTTSMTSFALLFTLAAIGASETSYLIRKRLAAQQPVCPIGEDCLMVLTSEYSTLFLIPNDMLGLLFYFVMGVIAAFLVIGIEPLRFWTEALTILVALGSILSAVFTYLQWRVINAWCFWCVMSAFTIWFMGIIITVSIFPSL